MVGNPNAITQMLNQFLGMGNTPQQIFQNLINTNPQMQIVFNQMQQSGLSPREYALQYAKQNNININPMVQMLQQRGIKL